VVVVVVVAAAAAMVEAIVVAMVVVVVVVVIGGVAGPRLLRLLGVGHVAAPLGHLLRADLGGGQRGGVAAELGDLRGGSGFGFGFGFGLGT
jgi:hypothetical protein